MGCYLLKNYEGMKKLKIFVVTFFMLQSLMAQTISSEEYINLYKDLAIREMKRMGVPAAITLAQGILETESGNSELVKKSNNHFGIKCKSNWTGAGVSHDDDAKGECFRQYNSAEDSYRDHSNFLRGNQRYASLFILKADDYKGWAYGLKKAGYATNPKYPAILIKHIEQFNLQQYSLAGMDELPQFDASQFQDDKEVPVAKEDSTFEKIVEIKTNNEKGVFKINGSKVVQAKKGQSLLALAAIYHIDLSKLLAFNELIADGILSKDQLIFLEKKSKTGERDNYTVQSGDNLPDIAQKNGMLLAYLLEYNKLTITAQPSVGKVLILKPLQVKSVESKFHVVAPKEGLYSIAKKYQVTVADLKKWNKLDTDQISIGQRLKVSE